MKPKTQRGVLTDRDLEVLDQLPTDEYVRPMDVGGRNSSHHSATLAKLVRYGLAEQKRHYRGITGGHWRYRRVNMVHEAVMYVRALSQYDCAGVNQDSDATTPCGKCAPCEAGAFLRRWGL